MKNYLKMIPVIAGLALATIGSTSDVKAENSSSVDDATTVGYCDNSSRLCGETAQGTTLYGRWNEGPSTPVEPTIQ